MGDLISSLLFQPPHPTFLHPNRYFHITPSHGTPIAAFYIKSRRESKVTILFSHGNAEDLGMIYDWFSDLSRVLNVNIMSYDYCGYGHTSPASTTSTTTSSPPALTSEDNVYADIEAAYNYLLTVQKLHPSNIVLYGRSLGSGPSCYLAQKTALAGHSVAGLILQSPLLSAYRVAFNFRFTMPGDKFPNIDRARDLKCPVFIIHGTQDEVVPFWHGQEMFLSVPPEWRVKPFWVQDAGHNNIELVLRDSGAFIEQLGEFLELYVPSRRGRIGVLPVEVTKNFGVVRNENGNGGVDENGGENGGGEEAEETEERGVAVLTEGMTLG